MVGWSAASDVDKGQGHARGQQLEQWVEGELVYYYRSGKRRRLQQSHGHGQYLGPARILTVEKRDGVPTNRVWIVAGSKLLLCATQQLRRASPRESAAAEVLELDPERWRRLRAGTAKQRRQAADAGLPYRYTDISEEPSIEQQIRAQDLPPAPVRTEQTADDIPAEEQRPAGQPPKRRRTTRLNDSDSNSSSDNDNNSGDMADDFLEDGIAVNLQR